MDTDVIRANVRHIAWPFGGWLHGAVAGRGLGRYQQQARAMAHVGGRYGDPSRILSANYLSNLGWQPSIRVYTLFAYILSSFFFFLKN